jgi:hypothetical protein
MDRERGSTSPASSTKEAGGARLAVEKTARGDGRARTTKLVFGTGRRQSRGRATGIDRCDGGRRERGGVADRKNGGSKDEKGSLRPWVADTWTRAKLGSMCQ